jgi:hypothetical protein
MAESAETIAPDEAAFRAHTGGGRFLAGVDAGEWGRPETCWPHAIIAVSAAERDGSPDEYFLRFLLSGYPNVGATACVWNADEGRMAMEAERPKVRFSPSPFRTDWRNGEALYLACDRVAADTHSDWPQKYPGDLWDPKRGISKYLISVHEILHSDAYTGI